MSYRKNVTANTYHRAGTVQAPERSELLSNLQSLVNFTEGSSRAVQGYMQRKIDADVIRQTSRTRRNELPSDDATRAGYRAATSLAMTNAMAEVKAQLDFAATENLTDEQWDNKFVEADTQVREILQSKYGDMVNDEAILKQIETGLTSMMPELTVKREANRLKRVQEQRIADASEFLLLNKNASEEDLQKMLTGFQTETNLDERSVIKMGVETAIRSGDSTLIDKFIRMKTSKGVDVIDQFPALREAKTKAELAEFKANQTQWAVEQRNLEVSLVDGTMSIDDYYAYVDEKNKATGGQFLTVSATNAIVRRAENERIRRQEQAARNAELERKKALKGRTKAEIQSDFNAYYQSAVETNVQNMFGAEVKFDQLSPEQQTLVLTNSIRDTDTAANAQFGRVDAWADNLKSVANSSADDVIIKDKEGNESLSPKTLAQLNLFKAIPPERRDQYATGRDAKFLNSYTAMVENGMSPPVAFAEAQRKANQPTIVRSEANADWAKGLVSDYFKPWFGANIPKAQEDFAQDYIIGLRAQGMSDEDVTKALEHNTYQMSNGKVVMANVSSLMTALGVKDPSQIERVFEGYIGYMPEPVKARMEALGFSKEEVFWDVDKGTGRAFLRGRGGTPIHGSGFSLQAMSDLVSDRLTDSAVTATRGTGGLSKQYPKGISR